MNAKLTVLLLLTGLTAAADSARYANDFSVRESTGTVQTGDWYELPYVVGQLALNAKTSGAAAPYGDATKMQDTWVKAWFPNEDPVGTVSVVAGDNGNPHLRFSTDAVWPEFCPRSLVMQPFYNSISTGVLRVSADLRTPLWWPKGGTGYFRIQPLFRSNLRELDWSTSTTCAQWGFQKVGGHADSSWDGSRFIHYFGNGQGGGADAVEYTGVTPSHWYRFVMDIDLATGKMTGRVYDQGTAQPAKGSANGSQALTFPEKTVFQNVTATTGPIEGIALRMSTFAAKEDMATHYPSCDNIVCSWKAPGAETFEPFYENDFATRRYRALSPAGTAEHAYARTSAAGESSYEGYASLIAPSPSNLVAQLVDSTAGRPVALGGWRRRSGGDDRMDLVALSGNSGVLQLSRRTASGDFVGAQQTLGETITSGKVRLSFDFRTPDKWYYRLGRAYAALSSKAFYEGSVTACAAIFGIASQNGNDANFYLYRNDGNTESCDTAKTCKKDTWYQGVLTVDLDARTYDAALYEIGDAPVGSTWTPSGGPLYAVSGLLLHPDITEISSLGLFAYGPGPTGATGPVCFDNVKVWKDWNGSDGTRIYFEAFSKQTRPFAAGRGLLVDTLHRDDGQDHWIRRQEGRGDVWITPGANPAVAATSAGDYSLAVQSFGTRFTGKFSFRVDIRPPQMWTYSAHSACVRLGGDIFLQGGMGSAAGADKFGPTAYGLSVGFGDKLGTKSNGAYRNVNLLAFDGNGDGGGTSVYAAAAVETSHWYRFKVKGDVGTGKYKVSVYDMGTAHPEADTPVGTLVATWENLGFRWPLTEGVSSIGLATYGNPAWTANDPEDPGLVLYDNIEIRETDGMAIILR